MGKKERLLDTINNRINYHHRVAKFISLKHKNINNWAKKKKGKKKNMYVDAPTD